MDDLIRQSKVAEILGCTHSAVEYRVKNNLLEPVEIKDGVKFFNRASVEKYAKLFPRRNYSRRRKKNRRKENGA